MLGTEAVLKKAGLRTALLILGIVLVWLLLVGLFARSGNEVTAYGLGSMTVLLLYLASRQRDDWKALDRDRIDRKQKRRDVGRQH